MRKGEQTTEAHHHYFFLSAAPPLRIIRNPFPPTLRWWIFPLLLVNKQMPAKNEDSKTICCWCCQSGPITAYVWIEKSGYVSGEPILFCGQVENHSRSRLLSTSVQLVEASCPNLTFLLNLPHRMMNNTRLRLLHFIRKQSSEPKVKWKRTTGSLRKSSASRRRRPIASLNATRKV